VPDRFIFRQVYYRDISIFAADGEIRSKNHPEPQPCHQTSYADIVQRRGTSEFEMPCGGVVNDYVPFYFSPRTAFCYTIHKGNVELRTVEGEVLGTAREADRAFVVCRADAVLASHCTCYFSNIALNSLDYEIVFGNTAGELKDGVIWSLFDDSPMTSHIPEIGYGGVCQYFHDRANPAAQQNRSRHRMAEFLVHERLPLSLVECIVVQNENVANHVRDVLAANDWDITVLVKQGCFFS
jgi:hypothetical protein